MKRILAPYGVNPKNLNQHLIDIGFIPQKKDIIEIKNELLFVYYNIIKKERENLEEELDIIYKYYNYGDEYDKNKIIKEDLQNKINYSTDCLIYPFDDGIIDYDAISEGYVEDDNSFEYSIDEFDDYGDYYDDYSHRRKN